MEEEITAGRDMLKILSVDTRMNIIKLLSEGDRTPSFIGQKLNKSESTIVEHLDILVKADLVKKTEQPGKKWVFYSLTETGKRIVSKPIPFGKTKLVIILVSTLVIFAAGFASLSYFKSVTVTETAVEVPKITTFEQSSQKIDDLSKTIEEINSNIEEIEKLID